MTFLRPAIIPVLALAALLAVLCLEPSARGAADPSGMMYWAEYTPFRIRRADLHGAGTQDVVTENPYASCGPSSMALDNSEGKAYWLCESDEVIQRASLAGGDVETLGNTLAWPRGIALDTASGKMYWTARGVIQRANLDGSGVEDVVARDGLIKGIALDLPANKMYWTGFGFDGGFIQRANLDGSGVDDLVAGGSPGDIALDPGGGKMYWGDGNRIQRANLDGSAAEQLISDVLPWEIALDVSGGKMYWTEWGYWRIRRANLDGSGMEDLITDIVGAPGGIALDLGPSAPAPTPGSAGVGGIVELRTDPHAHSDQPASTHPLPIGASVALGLLALGAGALYVVKLRRGAGK